MKRLLHCIVSIVPLIALAQPVNHFLSQDSRWFVAKTFVNASPSDPNFVATTTSMFGFFGDSAINNQQWLKLYSSPDSAFQTGLNFEGLIRYDNQRVLFRDSQQHVDTLYDFSLQTGDSALFNLYGSPEWLEITKIDTLTLKGQPYRRFYFEEPSIMAFDRMDEVWIEGIGSVHGPLFANKPVKFSTEVPDSMLLSCSFSGGVNIWHHSGYPQCFMNIVGIDEDAVAGFGIYPNPFSGVLNIERQNGGPFYFSLYTAAGLHSGSYSLAADQKAVDLSSLPSGLYFLRMIGEEGIENRKIIKE